MIPRTLHACLVGRTELTPNEKACVQSWDRVLPGFEVMSWHAGNGPIYSRFFREACEKKPINAVNYLRYWALYRYGGIYLDNDVEMLRPFDLDHGAFFGFQRDDTDKDCVNIAVIGAVRGHPFLKRIIDRLDADNASACPIWTGPGIVTDELRCRGLTGLNVEQKVDDIMVYAKDRMYPWRWDEEPDMSRVTERTFAIHRWEKSWAHELS